MLWHSFESTECWLKYKLVSGRSRGGAWVPPLFFDQNEARRAEKIFLETGHPPYLRVWMTPPPPLSKDRDPPLLVIIWFCLG